MKGFSLRSNHLAPTISPDSALAPEDRGNPPAALAEEADPHEILRLRIRKLIRDNGACFASVSEMLGRSHSYIQQYMTRRSPKCLREHDRRRIARHFNIPEWDLLLPEEQRSAAESNDLVLIPPWRSAAAAAIPAEIPEGAESARALMPHPFRREWLQARFGGAVTALAVAVITGDGMAPTLCHGDLVLIQRASGFHSDGIYLIEVAGQARARRMTAHPARDRIVISHDNPIYPDALECRPDELAVIGRIVWLSRAF